jgi:hypothetical protein
MNLLRVVSFSFRSEAHESVSVAHAGGLYDEWRWLVRRSRLALCSPHWQVLKMNGNVADWSKARAVSLVSLYSFRVDSITSEVCFV